MTTRNAAVAPPGDEPVDMRTRPAPSRSLIVSLVAAGCLAIFAAGCQGPGESPSATGGPTKVKVAYLGLTCEAAMFVAKEKGFFEEEGLDVEFVKTDWDGLRDGLGLGRFDANHTLIMYLLKPIEQGLDVKITGGIHSGCLRLQAGAKSDIKTVARPQGQEDRRADAMGSPPFLFASRVLAAHGMDPTKDVEWVVVAPDVLGLALDNGQVDAVCRRRADRLDPARAGEGPDDRRPGGGRPVPRRVLLRRGRQRQAGAREPGGGREGDAGAAQGGQVGRTRTRRPRPSSSVEKKYIAASAELNAQAISQAEVHAGRVARAARASAWRRRR